MEKGKRRSEKVAGIIFFLGSCHPGRVGWKKKNKQNNKLYTPCPKLPLGRPVYKRGNMGTSILRSAFRCFFVPIPMLIPIPIPAPTRPYAPAFQYSILFVFDPTD